MRLGFLGFFLLSVQLAIGQNVESFGIYTGVNVPFTVDQGLRKDPRFFPKIILRATPIGVYYGYDKSGYGFAITPSWTQLGQRFNIQNTDGGEVGTRDMPLNYLTVPVTLKIHINDLSFFRLSLVASLAPSYLISGKETLTWDASKLKYPVGVTVPTDPGYTKTYDGVYVPQIKNQVYVSKDKFSAFQVFAALGLRSDFDLNEDWSINFDGRVNFGILDPRSTKYISALQTPSSSTPDANGQPGAPDIYGSRRDMYLSLQIGFCRIINSKQKFTPKTSGKVVYHRNTPTNKNKNKKVDKKKPKSK
jgi:Outer membrane protein beta-barrel domain